jgi:nucleotide-binding universal stress UspA family protein
MRLLVALELTEPRAMTQWVQQLADRLDAELLVLHVRETMLAAPAAPVDPMTGLIGLAPYSELHPGYDERLRAADRSVFTQYLAEHFHRPILPALREGAPVDVILDDAEAENADLVVLGQRSQSGLERLLAGSVVSSVVRRSTRPTLVVPVIDPEPQQGK